MIIELIVAGRTVTAAVASRASRLMDRSIVCSTNPSSTSDDHSILDWQRAWTSAMITQNLWQHQLNPSQLRRRITICYYTYLFWCNSIVILWSLVLWLQFYKIKLGSYLIIECQWWQSKNASAQLTDSTFVLLQLDM